MRKIMIIGCPGAGKSTFARKLRDATGIPLYCLDMIWHKPDRTTVTEEVFDKEVGSILEQKKWIMDGNFTRTLEMRIKKCDTVFLLDYPLDVCLAGVESRIGKVCEDMPWVEREFDEEFKQFIVDFPHKQLPDIYKIFDRYKEQKDIIIFRSRNEAEKYVSSC